MNLIQTSVRHQRVSVTREVKKERKGMAMKKPLFIPLQPAWGLQRSCKMRPGLLSTFHVLVTLQPPLQDPQRESARARVREQDSKRVREPMDLDTSSEGPEKGSNGPRLTPRVKNRPEMRTKTFPRSAQGVSLPQARALSSSSPSQG